MELGINFFDHADIYGGGSCEEIFRQSGGYEASVREKMILQSKCSIRMVIMTLPGGVYPEGCGRYTPGCIRII